jgi:hypothetical protein
MLRYSGIIKQRREALPLPSEMGTSPKVSMPFALKNQGQNLALTDSGLEKCEISS